MAQATSRQVDNPREPNPDWRQGYGFQFWMARHGYRGDGAYGQFCIVLPEQDLVIATTAATQDMQGILDAVWEHVLPAIDATDRDHEGDAGDEQLADRLAHGVLPPRPAKAEPEDRSVWDGAAFLSTATAATEPWPPVAGPQVASAGLRAVDDGWRLALTDAGGTLHAAVGSDDWAVSDSDGVSVAVSGGWSDPDTFAADVIFLETPHTLRVTCSGPDRTVASHWTTIPLHARSLLELRRP